MMSRRGLLQGIGGGAAALFGLAGCGSGGDNRYRFRLTLEVATSAGVARGASVYEVAAGNRAALAPGGSSRTWAVTGEALAVDLPGGRTLFALLRTGAIHRDLAGLSMAALDPAFRNDMVESAARIAAGEGVRSPADVPPSNYPLLVTFADTADPASVTLVDPADLPASFGAGVRLSAVKVELTGDPVTTGLTGRLPWLAAGPADGPPATGPRLKGNPDPYDHSPITTLAYGDFIRR